MALQTLGSEVLVIAATPKALTPPTDDDGDTIHAVIGPIEDASIRYITDGDQTVSATVGHLIPIGAIIHVWGMPDILGIRLHRTGGTSANANVSYEG